VAVLRDDLIGHRFIEELTYGVDALRTRDIGDICRRFHAKVPVPAVLEMPEHDTVVAAELHDEGIVSITQNAVHDHRREVLEMHLHVA
jgi:hypothetical protein